MSPFGIASQGIVPKYDLKSPAERSLDTKMTSKEWPAAFTLLYVLTSSGVKALHGGHLQRDASS